MKPAIKYINKDQAKFFSTLRKRVDGYFKENQLSKFGSTRLAWKAVGILALYFVPYFLIQIGSYIVVLSSIFAFR